MRYATTYHSPLGKIRLLATNTALTHLLLADENPSNKYDCVEQANEVLAQAIAQLKEYFAGDRKAFTIPLAVEGTPFQKKVWQALEEIPYGETRSYKEIAVAVGSPKGFRAVGGANNKNSIAIIIPCHRVIGAGGALVGYASGTDNKSFLLKLEKAYR